MSKCSLSMGALHRECQLGGRALAKDSEIIDRVVSSSTIQRASLPSGSSSRIFPSTSLLDSRRVWRLGRSTSSSKRGSVSFTLGMVASCGGNRTANPCSGVRVFALPPENRGPKTRFTLRPWVHAGQTVGFTFGETATSPPGPTLIMEVSSAVATGGSGVVFEGECEESCTDTSTYGSCRVRKRRRLPRLWLKGGQHYPAAKPRSRRCRLHSACKTKPLQFS